MSEADITKEFREVSKVCHSPIMPKIKTCCIALWVPKHGSVGQKVFFFLNFFLSPSLGRYFSDLTLFFFSFFSRPLLADISQILML